jgi:hypothetical protein
MKERSTFAIVPLWKDICGRKCFSHFSLRGFSHLSQPASPRRADTCRPAGAYFSTRRRCSRAFIGNGRSESSFQAENIGLRELLTQAGLDAARLLAQAGIDSTENEAAKQLQQLLLEELHHRVKNTLATVIAITAQSLRNAESLEQSRIVVESRLFPLGPRARFAA